MESQNAYYVAVNWSYYIKKAKKNNCDWQCKSCNKIYKTIYLLDEINEKMLD